MLRVGYVLLVFFAITTCLGTLIGIVELISGSENASMGLPEIVGSVIYTALLVFGAYKLRGKLKKSKKTTKPSSKSEIMQSTASAGDKLSDQSTQRGVLSNVEIKSFYNLCSDVLEDQIITLEESMQLKEWITKYPNSRQDFRTCYLAVCLDISLLDGKIDADEHAELFTLLNEFCFAVEEQGIVTPARPALAPSRPKTLASKPKVAPSAPISRGKGGTGFVDALEADNEYLMGYISTSGSITERPIIFKRLEEKNDNVYMYAICLMRNGVRTFRADRVLSLVDLGTGEDLMMA